MSPEKTARPEACPRCGRPLSYDPATGLHFCPDPACGAVVSVRTAVFGGGAPARPLDAASTHDAAVGPPPLTEPLGEARHGRAWRVLVAVAGCVITVAILATSLFPALWSGSPALSVTPHALNFDEAGGAMLPLAFAIENAGSGRLEWHVESDVSWLLLSPVSGSLDGELGIVTASVDVTSLSAGTHGAECTITAPGARNSPQVVSVVLTVHSSPESRAITAALGDSVEVAYGRQPPYVADSGGSPIRLVNGANCRDLTWRELVSFLLADPTDESPYVQDERMCGTFAEQLHNNAEAAGIRAAWVSVDLRGRDIGHALNAFVTTDRGLVFVDSTGDDPTATDPSDVRQGECEADRIAYIQVGSDYGLVPVDRTLNPSYDFYVTWTRAWESYLQSVTDFNALVSEYNAIVSGRTLAAGSAEARQALQLRGRLEAMNREIEMQREVLGPCRWTSLGVVEFVRIYW